VLQTSIKLHNGVARITLRAPEGAKVGEELAAEFGFMDNGRNVEPLKVDVVIKFTKAEKPQQGGGGGQHTGVRQNAQQGAGQPEFILVGQDDWADHGFDDDAGAYVATSETPRVYVNRDNRYLVNMRVKEKDEAARVTNENTFKMGLGLIALAVYKKSTAGADSDDQRPDRMDPDAATRQATSAIAPYIVTIVRRLGGAS
jgi:hypothetical protein